MGTAGIDRRRGEAPKPSQLGPSFGPVYHSMPTVSVAATSANEISQRYKAIVHSLYSSGVGRRWRSSRDLKLGSLDWPKLPKKTGRECYSLGTSTLVSFKPYLERFQKTLDNQYYLVFLATLGKKGGLQRVRIQTEASNSEILAPDNVWVPAVK